jgi:hypothetical protein
MTLREARVQFTYLFSQKLISKALELGFDCAFDEITQHQNKGHKEGSLHYSGCAGDLLLYDKNGTYLPFTESYQELGEYWETLNVSCKWGGRWGDGNHFSFCPHALFGDRK